MFQFAILILPLLKHRVHEVADYLQEIILECDEGLLPVDFVEGWYHFQFDFRLLWDFSLPALNTSHTQQVSGPLENKKKFHKYRHEKLIEKYRYNNWNET